MTRRRRRPGPADGGRRGGRPEYVGAPLYLIGAPPAGVVCSRCDELIDDPTAVNVPGLTARGWAHRTCLPDWLLP